jgi:hypothetical protein
VSTALDERTDEATDLKVQEPGDHDLFAHYVKKAAIARAAVEGTPAVALCGKQWVPTRDGEKFPVCPDCKDIFENVVETKVPGGN